MNKMGTIKKFAQFEKGGLSENERNWVEDKSFSASIDEASEEDSSDAEYTNMKQNICESKY